MRSVSAAIVTAHRNGNELRLEFVQPVGKNGFAGVIAAGVEWFDIQLNRNQNLQPGVGGSFPRFR